MYNIYIYFNWQKGDKNMFKKVLVFLLAFVMLFCVGCMGNNEVIVNTDDEGAETEPILSVNSLTGLKDISDDKLTARPVSVMVNNISIAQGVQAGLATADIIYETEVEGGITRLMAVYKDIEAAGQIGTVRSARYAYVDLSMGHGAVYIHSGSDPIYCRPHLKDVDDIDIGDGKYGKRQNTGLASEHTLYTDGETLLGGIKKNFKNTEVSATETWVKFADEDENVTLSGGAATSISVPFSSSYVTKFAYNAETGKYDRLVKGAVQKDYKTGEAVSVENVFVLLTNIADYPDGKHRNIALTGGDGYYFANGTYTFIKWQKGAADKPITFTDAEGNELKVSAGNSWVCIADKQKSNPTYQ